MKKSKQIPQTAEEYNKEINKMVIKTIAGYAILSAGIVVGLRVLEGMADNLPDED